MSYVHHTTLQPRRRFACLAAVSLASVLAAAATTFAAPIGDPVKPATGGQGNALIQKSGSAPAGVVRISAVAASPAKSAAAAPKPAQKPVTKAAVVPPVKKPAPATKTTPPVSKPAAGGSAPATSAPATSAPDSGGSSAPPAPAQAASSSASPFVLLVNLNAEQYFNQEMQANDVQELLVLFQQNVDPNASQTAKVDGQKVVAAVKAARGESPSGWVMLDYEVPFDSIFWNGRTDPRYNGMVTSMIEAIKYAKAQLPNCKFTYYGVPNVRYYVANKGWDIMPEWSRIQTRDECMDVYLSLVKEMDWISPCIYDRFDPAMHEVSERASLAARESAYRLNVVKICDALRDAVGKPAMPIIPSVSVVYEDHGKAKVWAPIAHEEFRSDQLDPAIMAGADGFFLWSSLEYNAWVASLAWVPTPGEQARTDARTTLAKLLYQGSAPASWTTADSKAETARRVSNFMAGYAKWVREAEHAVPRPTAVASGPSS